MVGDLLGFDSWDQVKYEQKIITIVRFIFIEIELVLILYQVNTDF